MPTSERKNPTTTQLLNLAHAKQILNELPDSETKRMLVRAVRNQTKALTGESHKPASS